MFLPVSNCSLCSRRSPDRRGCWPSGRIWHSYPGQAQHPARGGFALPSPYQNLSSTATSLRLQLLWTVDNADGHEAHPYIVGSCSRWSPDRSRLLNAGSPSVEVAPVVTRCGLGMPSPTLSFFLYVNHFKPKGF